MPSSSSDPKVLDASEHQTPNGIVIVDKPTGPTSHDIVAQARRYFRTKRVGHAGTLDPLASGVLLILLGEATKLSQALTLERKSYQAEVTFGVSTSSDDAQGEVLEQVELGSDWLTDEALHSALEFERNRTEQLPPVVTAIKQDGMAAHKRLRKGLEVTVEPRVVRVFELTLLGRQERTLQLDITVSKGYYVRALARDLGKLLGVPAHLSRLRRTASGDFRITEAITWPPQSEPTLLSLEEVVERSIPRVKLNAEGTLRARVGKLIGPEHVVPHTVPGAEAPLLDQPPLPSAVAVPMCAWMSEQGRLIALGQFDASGIGKVLRGFQAAG